MNAADYLSLRYGKGPSQPHFAQMVKIGSPSDDLTVTQRFGDPAGGGRIAREMTFSGIDNVFAPHWVSVRRIPDVAAMTAEDRAELEKAWPSLKGFFIEPVPFTGLDEADLLLTVWPGAFRQLEQVWAGLDLPLPTTRRRPQMPVPRYFLVRGLTSASIHVETEAVIAEQFTGGTPPSMDAFLRGVDEVLFPVGNKLGTSGGTLRVSVFDEAGLPIDPSYVFGTYALLTGEVPFLAKPDVATAEVWGEPQRHVFVFCDHRGHPYRPFTDPADPFDVMSQDVTPSQSVTIEGTTHAIPDHGVVIVPAGLSTTAISTLNPFGEGVRFALEPHGTLTEPLEVGLHEWSFVRVRVVDYARYFPRNPNPLNQFQRYTEGNEYLPLADGRNAFRELYRAVRSTYEEVEYQSVLDDPPATQPVADPSQSMVLAIDAWYASKAPMLGRRAMLRTPRTQLGGLAAENEPSAGRFPYAASELVGRFGLIPEESFPDGSPASPSSTSRRYWCVAPNGSLPPGGWLRLVQLDLTDDVVGPDPGDIADVAVDDIYGAFVAVEKQEGFVGPQGQVAVAVTYDPDWALPDPGGQIQRLRLDAAIWESDEDDPDPAGLTTVGKGKQRHRAYGQTELLFPLADPLNPPDTDTLQGVNLIVGAHLELGSEVGEARVVLPSGMLTEEKTVTVLNPRSGDLWWKVAAANPSTTVEVPVENMAYEDTLLVSFLVPPAQGTYPPETAEGPGPDVSLASHLFALKFGIAEKLSGAAAIHPRESLGMARKAIGAGVDARLLAWRDDRGSVEKQVDHSLGGVVGYNSTAGGQRGQALLDGLTRISAAHHQKPTFVRNSEEVLAFVGGVDQTNGRYDHPTHPEITPERPGNLWHDAHCRVRGLAALDVYRNFRDRWNAALENPEQVSVDENWDDTPLDPALQPLPDVDNFLDPKSPKTLQAKIDGPHTVQINRTIAPKLDFFSGFLDPGAGDQSIRASYEQIFEQAQRFVYLEDQYFFHVEYAKRLHDKLKAGQLEFVVLVVPELLAEAPYLDLALYAIRRRALAMLLYGQETVPANPEAFPNSVADKVAIFHIRNDFHRPIYVHAKCIIADDLWMSIGSANFIRRSMNFDSEIAAAVVDSRLRRGGHRVARDFRIAVMAEHLRLRPSETPLLEDPLQAFALIKDVLAGRDSRETGIYPVDFNFTTHGEQPDELNGDFWDIIRLVIDPDGDELEVPGRLLTLVPLLNRLRSGPADPSFSDFGYLRVTTAWSGTPPADPADLEVTFEVSRSAGETFYLGPFPADQPAQLALLETGVSYLLGATAALKSDPETVVAFQQPLSFDATAFLNEQTVTLDPVSP